MKKEYLLYTNNKFAYNLILLIVAINTLFLILTLNQMTVNIFIGVYIMFNLAFTMILFLLAVKINIYDVWWTKFCFIMALVSLGRVFFVPGGLTGTLALLTLLSYILCSGLFLIAAKSTQKKIKIRGELNGKLES